MGVVTAPHGVEQIMVNMVPTTTLELLTSREEKLIKQAFGCENSP